mmetsp:Transcript_25577/g.37638  ORF Transcript_25577/g.37638 Transcript_25577/m.37638 type:complete len:82 (+) Transcript_25577:1694-1939(+)
MIDGFSLKATPMKQEQNRAKGVPYKEGTSKEWKSYVRQSNASLKPLTMIILSHPICHNEHWQGNAIYTCAFLYNPPHDLVL